jgi:hypothetical protein
MQEREQPASRRSKGRLPLSALAGERCAVKSNSGATVTQSVPVLRRPTSLATSGRNPEARPPFFKTSRQGCLRQVCNFREAVIPTQHKTGRGAGQSPAIRTQRAALGNVASNSLTEIDPSDDLICRSLDEGDIGQLIEYVMTLDRWDREAHEEIM